MIDYVTHLTIGRYGIGTIHEEEITITAQDESQRNMLWHSLKVKLEQEYGPGVVVRNNGFRLKPTEQS